MTKNKAESEYVMIRRKCEDSDMAELTFAKNNEKLDLTDYRCIRMFSETTEEWVHKDEYEHFYEEYRKFNGLMMRHGAILSYISEPDKEFRESSGNEVQNKYIRIIKKCRELVKDHP